MTGGLNSGDERGEALPVAILFLGVFFTILIGIHVVLAAMARTAVQAAADAALAAAQSAGDAGGECDNDGDGNKESARQCSGVRAARIAMDGASGSVIETRPPFILVEQERGLVTATVFGGTITPVLGGLEFIGQACGPLDDVPPTQLTGNALWQC